ncbi:MAG: acetate--CoA ligase family protein [Actinobacteria bacterium]|nr:acetate--CoA ligase family protein [Actinomycetota bacterium]
MKLYEFQGKEIFNRYGIPVPRGKAAADTKEAIAAAEEIGLPVMVKAQILQGGRGKAGGIKRAGNPGEVSHLAESFLTAPLKNEKVKQVLVEEVVEHTGEYYLGITIDDRHGCPVVIASSQGGMEIEEIAKSLPGKLIRCLIDPVRGLRQHEAMEIAKKLDLKGNMLVQMSGIIFNLYGLFVQKDAQLAEINPLLLNNESRFIAGDAKIIINDDALFRQNEYKEFFIEDSSASRFEAIARSKGFNYVDLGGRIGLVSIGAGFGMMIVDVIAQFGCRPANFLDASGGMSVETFKELTELIISKADEDSRVKVILACCGIAATKLENIVAGLTAALREHPSRVPVIASFTADGPSTLNMALEEAGRILTGAGISYYPNLRDAIEAAVRISKEEK